MQARRNRQRRGWNGGGGLPRVAFALRFQHGLRHFLNEQRDAVSALDNVLPNALRQRLVARDAVDHGNDFALPKPVEREGSDEGPTNPRRFELGSVRDNQQNPKSSQPVYRPTKRLKACRVDPMHILENHQHRIRSRQCLHLRSKCFYGSLSSLLRSQIERWIASIVRQRQHVRK